MSWKPPCHAPPICDGEVHHHPLCTSASQQADAHVTITGEKLKFAPKFKPLGQPIPQLEHVAPSLIVATPTAGPRATITEKASSPKEQTGILYP